jgi:hypothetical protein
MRHFVLALLVGASTQAAVVRGVVVEGQTGRPLARALVVVQPIAGTNGATQSVRSNPYRAFEFASMPGGAYLAVRADARGQYRVSGLGWGTYRLVSTFEYLDPDSETIGTAAPVSVLVDAHAELARELDLWVIR